MSMCVRLGPVESGLLILQICSSKLVCGCLWQCLDNVLQNATPTMTVLIFTGDTVFNL